MSDIGVSARRHMWDSPSLATGLIIENVYVHMEYKVNMTYVFKFVALFHVPISPPYTHLVMEASYLIQMWISVRPEHTKRTYDLYSLIYEHLKNFHQAF